MRNQVLTSDILAAGVDVRSAPESTSLDLNSMWFADTRESCDVNTSKLQEQRIPDVSLFSLFEEL